MKITIWGDFACPFCYLGETILDNVLKEIFPDGSRKDSAGNDITIDLKAYELDPEAPETPVETMTQHFSTSHGISEDDAKTQMARITKIAARAGLDYNLEGVEVCSTFDAHRLIKYAKDNLAMGKVLELNLALFHASFVENVLLSDREVLADIAMQHGLEREEVLRMLDTDRYIEAVRADEKEADKLDLEFIPYLLFDDGTVLQGVLSHGAVKKAVVAALEK